MTTYYPAFTCYMMSFLITYPAATEAGSWCKKRCKAYAFFHHKIEIYSRSVPLLGMGFPGKKHPKHVFFAQQFLRKVIFLKSVSTHFEPVESKTLPIELDCGLFPSDFNSFCCLSRWEADKNRLLDEAVAFNYAHNEHSPSLIQ